MVPLSAPGAVRSEGHDLLAVSEMQQRSIDRELVELARADNRILLTEDDFGWWCSPPT